MRGEFISLLRGSIARLDRQQFSHVRLDGPERFGIGFSRDAQAGAANDVVVAVMLFEAERNLAVVVGERFLEFGDEEMALAEVRRNGPAGFWIAIDSMFRAVILLFPISAGSAKGEVIRAGEHRHFVENEVPGFVPAA